MEIQIGPGATALLQRDALSLCMNFTGLDNDGSCEDHAAMSMPTSLAHHITVNGLTICNYDLCVLMKRLFSAFVLCLILMPQKVKSEFCCII